MFVASRSFLFIFQQNQNCPICCLQWNGGYYIADRDTAQAFQLASFPDWSVELSVADAAHRQWAYTLRLYDQTTTWDMNGNSKYSSATVYTPSSDNAYCNSIGVRLAVLRDCFASRRATLSSWTA